MFGEPCAECARNHEKGGMEIALMLAAECTVKNRYSLNTEFQGGKYHEKN